MTQSGQKNRKIPSLNLSHVRY